MRYWLRFLLLTVLLLTSVGYTFAQDEDVVTLPLGGAFTMSVPESWEITQPTSSGYFFESSDSTIRIRTYSPLDLEVFEVEVGNATDLMEYLVTVAYEADYDEDLLETVQFGDHEGVRYTLEELFEGRTFQRTVMLYTSETDFVIGGNLIPLEGSEVDADDTDAVAAALATVEYPGVFAFYEGSELEIPEEWHLLHDSNVSFSLATFTNGSLQFDLRLWPSYGAISGLDTPVDFLANFFFDNGIFSDIS